MSNNINYDDSVSYAKGLAIMLMVLCHTYFSTKGIALIGMFHMPFFFFISGYCFRNSHLGDFRKYANKRFSKLYIPFVKYSLLFLLLHNLFFHLNIYNDLYGSGGVVSYLYSSHDYLKRVVLILFCLSGNEQLLGGYWFLHTLFFSSFIFYGLLKLKIPITGVIVSIFSSILLVYNGIPYKEIFAVSFMLSGYIYKSYSIDKFIDDYSVIVMPICLIFLILGSVFWHGSMLDLKWVNTIPYFISAISGSIITMKVSKYMVKKIQCISNYIIDIGNKTIKILTWHFLCFKLVSLIIIAYYGLPIEHLAEFPVIFTYSVQGWWICYFIVGVAVPIIGTFFTEKLTIIIKRLWVNCPF